MLAVAVAVAAVSALAGVYLSFFIDSAPAPTIVLVMTGLFIAAFACRSAMAATRTGRKSGRMSLFGGERGRSRP
jgi:manganese/iron transport system permease protein